MERWLAEIEDQTGLRLRLVSRLSGGEQGGAHLVAAEGSQQLVLKIQRDPGKAARLLRAVPVMAHTVGAGWPAAAWSHAGRLSDGAAFLLLEWVDGEPVQVLDEATMRAILTANERQAGLGTVGAFDDSEQLRAVVSRAHPWPAAVADHSTTGSALARHADALIRRIGPAHLPDTDVVHGDYSSANLLLTRDGTIRFVDCETVGRGTRVRDLADLYRQCVIYPGTSPVVMGMLRDEAVAIAGAEVFATCFVGVAYNNLAWWAEHRPVAEFDEACSRVDAALDGVVR